ncbi:Murein hydrolase activator NlpD [Andreprevotia sp. IGB-42]|uniref:peptidoglycan DD-metalloendopeptidase family protein n=1 Tax=Andreprevotia sp. IGB-42 TaxID=2497473 RepID=UPI00135BC952|nr:peptidoglycan DD-metalloendopeptidase family protein [Andreprevotia sp. IGB-42]KAF0814176.1 Murein hydrolase activator NlpD [Andreprevotia sp. IGB-42]
MSWQRSLVVSLVLMLAACANEPRKPAPIVDRQPASNIPVPVVDRGSQPAAASEARPGTYTVRKGDTLYRIALDHGLSYRELAAWNNLNDVNGINVDQVLRLTAPDSAGNAGVETRPLKTDDSPAVVTTLAVAATPAPATAQQYPKAIKLPYSAAAASSVAALADGPVVAAKPQSDTVKPTPKPLVASSVASAPQIEKNQDKSSTKVDSVPVSDDADVGEWLAPTVGKPLKAFSEESRGIDIPGKMAQPILASGSGKIVYAGAGLRGYGKMIIIKHNKEFLTAYAHNSKLLVKEGDSVKKGEKIAEMGNTDTDQVKLHFEIRRFGKPVDPAKFIQLEKP